MVLGSSRLATSSRNSISTLIIRSCRSTAIPSLQTRRVSGSTVITASLKEKAKGAVLAAAEKLDMAHKLVHRHEEKDLRAQAKADAQDDITPVSRQHSLPWEKDLLEPSLKDVKLVSRKPRKLIVACDGTWVNSNNDVPSPSGITKFLPSIFSQTRVTLPSNITRLCRALNTSVLATDSKEPLHTQIIYYHNGVGTDGGIVDKLIGGATGATISEHIRECYGFLCNNWQPGDEIFLFGFSRGAYTARCISSLINDIGLLTAKGMEFFYQIFEDWKDQNLPDKLKEQEEQEKVSGAKGAFKGMARTPKMPSQRYVDALKLRGYTRDCYDDEIVVKALGVFDTVGALGVPPVFGLSLSPDELIQYSFVNTKVSNVVEHAIQALALDDHRAAFKPAVWEQPDYTPGDGLPKNDPKLKSLNQVWFPGVHSNVGGAGGYDDQSIANETLAWMVTQLQSLGDNGEPLLDFDIDYLHWVFELNVDHCNAAETVGGYRGWSLGKIEESLDLKYKFIGDVKPWQGWENWNDWKHPGDLARTPGRYTSCEAVGGRKHDSHRPLLGSNEKVHPSVRVRLARGGKGMDDQGHYFPKGLEGFRLVSVEGKDQRDPLAKGYKWIGQGPDGKQVTLEEEVVHGLEQELIVASAKAMAERLAQQKQPPVQPKV